MVNLVKNKKNTTRQKLQDKYENGNNTFDIEILQLSKSNVLDEFKDPGSLNPYNVLKFTKS